MELPADPRNLVYGIYDKMGRDITALQPEEKQLEVFALSDEEDYNRGSETPFGVVDYNYW
mgnify:CR=1 FL=1